jgi:hypothetical protein
VDRRLIAFAAAVLAALTVGCKDEPGPLFVGSESADLGPTTVEGDQTRAWMATAQVSLPAEASPSTFRSILGMDILFASDQESMDAAFVVRECDGGFVHTNLSFPRKGDTGSSSDESYELENLLADCPIQDACERTMCVEASNHRNAPLDLSVGLSVTLRSDAPTEDDGDTIDVPIELTVEEIVVP